MLTPPRLTRATAASASVPNASSPLIKSFGLIRPSVAVPKNAKQLPLLDTSNTGTDFDIYVESVYVLDTPSVPVTTTVILTVYADA